MVHPSLPRKPSIPLAVLDRPVASALDRGRGHPAKHAGPLRRRPDRRDSRRDDDRAPARTLDGRPAGRPQRRSRREGPRPRGPARRRPDRPLRLEAGVRHAGRFRQGGLRQRAGAVQSRPTAGHSAGQARIQGQGHRPDRRAVRLHDRLHSRPGFSTRGAAADSELAAEAKAGKSLFRSIGCADCHSESLGSGRRGCTPTCCCTTWGPSWNRAPAIMAAIIPVAGVRNDKFEDSQQPTPGEWRTAPLWGVADSAPYLHDGRAATLEEAIEPTAARQAESRRDSKTYPKESSIRSLSSCKRFAFRIPARLEPADKTWPRIDGLLGTSQQCLSCFAERKPTLPAGHLGAVRILSKLGSGLTRGLATCRDHLGLSLRRQA